ncbi:MAG: hypothetical protein ABEJ36_00465 [Candidatus Nanosalina sp.]
MESEAAVTQYFLEDGEWRERATFRVSYSGDEYLFHVEELGDEYLVDYREDFSYDETDPRFFDAVNPQTVEGENLEDVEEAFSELISSSPLENPTGPAEALTD